MSEIKAPPAIWHEGKLVSASDFGREEFEKLISETSDLARDKIDAVMKAYDFAKNVYSHGENGDIHRRTTGEPFFDHGKGVFLIDWIEFGQRDIHTLIAELLHDVPEENKATIFEIQIRFNIMVSYIVASLTNFPKTGLEVFDTLVKKFHFIWIQTDTQISKAKVCDRLYNLRTPPCTDSNSPKFQEAVLWSKKQLIETIELIIPLAKSLRDNAYLNDERYLEALEEEIKNTFLIFGSYFLPSDQIDLLACLKDVLKEADWMECVKCIQ